MDKEKEAGLEAWKLVHKYKRALKYLDECGELTHEKFNEVLRIAGVDPNDQRMQMVWETADRIMPHDGYAGKQTAIPMLRDQFNGAIIKFEKFAYDLGIPDPGESTPMKAQAPHAPMKKWWQFWR